MYDKIVEGMTWIIDEFTIEVTKVFKNGKCRLTETWIAYDTLKACKSVETYIIAKDKNGNEFVYRPQDIEYARPDKDDYEWWARKYANSAFYIRGQEV